MKISLLSFRNFRCFGPNPVSIDLNDISVLIGENGAGKSAALLGLARLFGLTKEQRSIRADDFHLPVGVSRSDADLKSLSLWIEARIEFDAEGGGDDTSAIPEHFKQMRVNEPGGRPYCRIRLEAVWQKGNLPEGEVEQSLNWIKTSSDISDEIDDEYRQPLSAFERQRIHVHYIPGARDPSKHVRVSSQSLLKRLLDAARWTDDLADSINTATDGIVSDFSNEPAITELQRSLNESWNGLYNRSRFKEIVLHLETQTVEDFVSSFTAGMKTEAEDDCVPVDRLSDGLRSLLYFSIMKSAFQIEQAAIDDFFGGHPFDEERLDPPLLTVFAVEEPETHLAPHLLGRVVKMFRDIVKPPRAQAIFSSHSPSVLARIEPEEIRYLRLDSTTAVASAHKLSLPTEQSDADKFIRQAVRAYPELYFARLVVLGEGDSEQVVMARLLDANDLPSDPNVISVVPLGGRHVNHMWRLLNSLSIPHLTLLDMDCDRKGGGWGRIHYVCEQLIELGHKREEILEVVDDDNTSVMSDETFAEMPNWGMPHDDFTGWVKSLRKYGVYFSDPLDLDYSMLRKFPEQYQETADGAPRILSKKQELRSAQITGLFRTVFGKKNIAEPERLETQLESLQWYRHLFLQRSKPATHMAALAEIKDEDLLEKCPDELKSLIRAIKAKTKNG
ncbi:hypothetical protein K227x_56200 [Rubripirellula lacrimiformis]|uniref:Uncharacterized protein n=1 Tax=Rubripirellula lacrimiformis TaxID=1930273 RepID=A0A517NJ91_9BACT|nr:AAA family ATPase [Rubripirellula lacrimiformis]QDT07195.1 hypothetical protein K227x_56200 [Rubripirellula lacrimiformis]